MMSQFHATSLTKTASRRVALASVCVVLALAELFLLVFWFLLGVGVLRLSPRASTFTIVATNSVSTESGIKAYSNAPSVVSTNGGSTAGGIKSGGDN